MVNRWLYGTGVPCCKCATHVVNVPRNTVATEHVVSVPRISGSLGNRAEEDPCEIYPGIATNIWGMAA